MATLKDHMWFSQTGLSPEKRSVLLERFGSPDALYLAEGIDFMGIPGITRNDIAALTDKSLVKTDNILKICEKLDIQIITMQDAAFPERLLNIPDPPQVLYIRGRLPDMDSLPVVAIVGTRRASEYGLRMSRRIGSQLARAGALVISGMALGIDSAANEAALNEGKRTVAVMGCGADICYPPEKRWLWQKIISEGAIVTEYAPGMRPLPGNFLERNRLISGLSLAVVLINVAARSGANNTARHAIIQGKELFCVPANVDSPDNEGVTRLLKEGAGIAENAYDVLAGFEHMFPGMLDMDEARFDKSARPRGAAGPAPEQTVKTVPEQTVKPAPEQTAKPAPEQTVKPAPEQTVKPAPEQTVKPVPEQTVKPAPEPQLEGAQKAIYDVLGEDTLHVDRICELSGLSAQESAVALTLLEIGGNIISLPGKFFRKT